MRSWSLAWRQYIKFASACSALVRASILDVRTPSPVVANILVLREERSALTARHPSFTLYSIAFSLELSQGKDRWSDAILGGLFLTLAILQKATTPLPVLPAFGLLYFIRAWPALLSNRIRATSLWKGMIAYVVPFLIGFAWVKYSDHVKMANAFGATLTSKALSHFIYGTMAQRFSNALWIKVIWHRVIGENIAGHLGVFVIIAGLVFVRARRVLIASGVVLFLLFFLVFTNLLYVHDYYPISNTV